MIFTRHVASKREEKEEDNAYRFLVRNAERKRPLRKSRRTGENKIKFGLGR
jgi:hypothetical protein